MVGTFSHKHDFFEQRITVQEIKCKKYFCEKEMIPGFRFGCYLLVSMISLFRTAIIK
jgi:hypothetical protein